MLKYKSVLCLEIEEVHILSSIEKSEILAEVIWESSILIVY